MVYYKKYEATEIGDIAVDLGGAFINGLISNAGLIIVGVIVIPLLALVLGRIFGIIKF